MNNCNSGNNLVWKSRHAYLILVLFRQGKVKVHRTLLILPYPEQNGKRKYVGSK